MNNNIRVNDLCDNFALRSQTTRYPDLLTTQIDTMCAIAVNGNPEVLESEEIDLLDNSFRDIYFGYPSTADFARVMTNTSLIEPIPDDYETDNLNFIQALYNGFAPIPVSEPPFMLNGLIIDKIAEDKARGTQTLLLNDEVQIVISPDKIAISAAVLANEGNMPSVTDIQNKLYSSIGRLTSANLLPFMAGYAGEDSYSTQNGRLEMPQGETYYAGEVVENTFAKCGGGFENRSRSLYVDSRGLFFFRRDKDDAFGDRSIYFASPEFYAPYIKEFKAGQQPIVSYNDHLKAKEDEDYCKKFACGVCFTGDMKLETSGGGKITFDDLYHLYRSGDKLPLLRAWNPDQNAWTYQEPAKVMRHLLPYNKNLHIIRTESGDELKVTGNHFLWIRREGREYWVRAEEIKKGDELLAGGGLFGAKAWNGVTGNIKLDKHGYLESIAQDETALEVFNISFGTGAGVYLNYGVCGDECAVAHNYVK